MRRLILCLFAITGLITSRAAAQAVPTINAAKYPNLQAALDAVPATGGIVLLPPGKFEITEPLLIKTEDTRVVGSGAATCIVNKNEKGQPALILRAPKSDPGKKFLWRVQLADFRITGQEKSGAGVFAVGIQEIYIEGLSIDHNGGHGIHLLDCTEDPRIVDSIITYNKGSGIELKDCHDIVVNANHFEENLDALRCIDSYNLCMNGNNIDDHLRDGVVIENTYGSVLSGNMIEECSGIAIVLDRDCYGINLSANVIAHHHGGGIDLRDAHGCTVSANTFTLTHTFSVRIGKDSGRNTVSANNFCNSHIGAGKEKLPLKGKSFMGIDGGAGILLEGASQCTITGNTFAGLATAAIWSTAPCTGLLISNNNATDCGRELPKASPWIAVDSTKSLIKDNLLDQ